jgi:hypothetical protein
MMNAEQFNEMYELFEAVREEVITDEQFSRLDQILAENKQLCKYYFEYINMAVLLKSGKAFEKKFATLMEMNDSFCDMQLWREMAEHEKASPGIKIVSAQASDDLIQEVRRQKPEYKISKGSIFTLFATAAAIVLIFVFARFAPPATGIKVAVLSDSINAKWADMDGTMEKGSSIFTSRQNLLLREGYAKLSYDNQVQVMIEGPAEFQVLAEDKINLRYGKIYATVPSKAIGFMITTQSAKVIDLGTEFGVWASFNGSTELHVYKGKTTLIAGVGQDSKQVVEVAAGKAKRIRSDNSQISDICLKQTLFVREIDSSKQLIWKGNDINLASLVAGGDGFTQGQVASGIDPATGDVHSNTVQTIHSGKNIYREVKDRPFIDGVFIPNGVDGPTVVSSAGHTFTFPQTENMCYSDITSHPYVHKMFPGTDVALSLNPLAAGKTADSSLIFIHSNAGITFNLDKIRQSLGCLEINRFKSSCGVSQGVGEINRSEFWVLIDGQCVFHEILDRDHPGVREIDIPITPEQKFLTLATTDGGDKISMDWCIFEKPWLGLVKKSNEVDKADREAGVEK